MAGRAGVLGSASQVRPDEPWGVPLHPLSEAADRSGDRALATPADEHLGASRHAERPPSRTRRNHSAERTRRIHCVDGTTGEPLAGVRLCVVPRTRSAWTALERAMDASADPEEVVERLGAQAVSDARGLASLPLPDAAQLLVLAAVDGRFASMDAVRGAPGPWEVELWPLRSLAVQLVDDANEPVRDTELLLSYRWPKPTRIARSRTDDRGVARFGLPRRDFEDEEVELSVLGSGPTAERPLAAFDAGKLPPTDMPAIVRLSASLDVGRGGMERPLAPVTLDLDAGFFMGCGDGPSEEAVVRGRVVDGTGQALRAVSARWVEWGCTAFDRGGWIALDTACASTDADGRFELVLGENVSRGWLQLDRTDLIRALPDIRTGGDVGTVTMRTRCDVFGTLHLPPLERPGDLELVAELGYCHFRVPVHPDGSFVVSLYPIPRHWDRGLKLSLHGERWVGEPLDLLSIPELAAGETDLGTIDLGILVASTRLEIVGDHGRPVKRIEVRLPGSSLPVFDVAGPTSRSQYDILDPYVHPKGGRRRLELHSREGSYVFHHRRESGAVSLEANGWSVSDRQLGGGDQRLVLGRP